MHLLLPYSQHCSIAFEIKRSPFMLCNKLVLHLIIFITLLWRGKRGRALTELINCSLIVLIGSLQQYFPRSSCHHIAKEKENKRKYKNCAVKEFECFFNFDCEFSTQSAVIHNGNGTNYTCILPHTRTHNQMYGTSDKRPAEELKSQWK